MNSNNTTKNTKNKKVTWAKTHLFEESILFISVIKWSVLASGIGILAGGATALFLQTLDFSIKFISPYNYFYLLLPLGLLLCIIISIYLAPESEGHGTEKVIEAVHERSGRIPLKIAPIKFVITIITLATGGSVGKEGPCAQIGGALASSTSTLLRLNDRERRTLVICGISAGFAAVFGTPVGGSIFALEVLVLGKMLYDVLFPSFISGIVGYLVARNLGIVYFHHTVDLIPKLSASMLVKSIFAGIIFGLTAYLLIETMEFISRRLKGLRFSKPVVALIAGFIIVPLALLFSPESIGLGTETMTAAIKGEEISLLTPLWKILFTSLTLGGGGSGGIVTPLFYLGSTTGNIISGLVGINSGTLAAMGMVAVLAGAANTPIAASIMGIEMFGPDIGPYVAISCITSFLIVGHRSVYGSQVISLSKSATIKVHPEKGRGVAEEEVEFVIRAKSIVGLIKFLWLKGVRYKRKRAGKGEERDEE